MFWIRHKSVKNISIVLRLTILYTLATLSILLIISFLLYYSLEKSLMNEGKQFLLGEYQVVQSILIKTKQDKTALNQEVLWEPTVSDEKKNRYFIRILDEHNKVQLQTPGMEKIISIPDENSTNQLENKPEFTFLDNHEIKHVLMLSSKIELNSGRYCFLQIILRMKKESHILEDYQQMLLIVLILGTLCSLVAGVFLAKKSMAPLKEMTKTVMHTTTHQLHERLNPQYWPQEMLELATGLNTMLDRLEFSFKRLTQFSADLAHELRTPINNLRGEAEICLSKTRTPAEYQEILTSSLEEYQRLSQMISGLLFLAQAENPKIHITREKVNIREIIEAVCDLYAALAEEKNITIHLEGEATVLVEPVLFRRIISNLLANAIKYTPKNGEVSIKIEEEAKYIHVSVRDTGIGIASENLPHVFDRFYRTDAARSQSSGGIGLGLAIVHSIMELHHGKVDISSQPHQGTTVNLYFHK